jgi:hypothetical protein
MKQQITYLKIPSEFLEKLKFIQDHISDPVSRNEILEYLLDFAIDIVTDSHESAKKHLDRLRS